MVTGAPDPGRASRRSPVPERLHFTRAPRWVRRLRLTAAALVLLALVVVGVALPLVVLPETQPVPGETDAVMLLAGGQGERLATAQRVIPRGDASLLIISAGHGPEWPQAQQLCGTAADGYDIECVEPMPGTTRGEARTAADLATARGWDAITLVTSTYHVTRARMLFRRCVDADVEAVGAPPELGPLGWVRVSARELAALVRDGLIQRGC